jgi:hypothetical protein
LEKTVINPLSVELHCQSKIRTLFAFHKRGIKIPTTIYVPCNVTETGMNGRNVDYTSVITDLIEKQLGNVGVVLKPDAGTHGRGIVLARDRESIMKSLGELSPSIINPCGVVAQEFIPKGFYDLRIIVWKERGKPYRCADTAMARGGFKDFRTNAHLGNMVFRVQLPSSIMNEAVKAGEAISDGEDVGVIALDAMPYFKDEEIFNERELKTLFNDLEKSFEEVRRVKADPNKLMKFKSYTKKVENAYEKYMASEPYLCIQKVIQESMEKMKDSVFFHEGNSCPEFWEQTRIVGGINVAKHILNVAKGMIDN